MKTASRSRVLIPVTFVALVASGAASGERQCDTAWSEPVNLGPPVNSAGFDTAATLSPNGLSLYFVSIRAGGVGLTDIWVSQRDCADCAWQEPVNLSMVNSTA